MSELRRALEKALRTDWFPASVRPARRGLYERDHKHSRFGEGAYRVRYSYWNGEWWGGWAFDRKSAFLNRKQASWEQSIPWRGLAERA